MEMMIHCPSCQARLNASKQAAGHTVRCPKCKKPFKVPRDYREIVEDTVACWLEISAEEEQARKQQAASIPDPLDELPEYVPPDDLPGLGDSEGDSGGAEISTTVQTSPPRSKTTSQPAKTVAPSRLESVAVPARPAVAAPAKPAPASPAPSAAAPSRPAIAHDHRADIEAGGEVRLRVLETHATGVRMGFDAALLKRFAFRASMPMSCIGCGETAADQLTARPLIWIDRLTDQSVAPAQVATRYEMPVSAHPHPQELTAAMRPIDEMAAPCNNPMPYYACRRCGTQAMVQATTTAEGTGSRCELTLPPAYALAWLGRVNGICGDDYLELEAFCGTAGGADDGLSDLPEQIRKRLTGWYTPADGERFVLYLKDADYPKADAGLGGVVLTDHRLTYCKYHKHGSLLLHDETTQLQAVRNGSFDDLISIVDGMKSKLVRLRPDDTEQLMTTLDEMECRVKLERAEP